MPNSYIDIKKFVRSFLMGENISHILVPNACLMYSRRQVSFVVELVKVGVADIYPESANGAQIPLP